MPRRLFKHVSRRRHLLLQSWFMRPFRNWLKNPACWCINRRSVTRAVALGLFIAFIPLPFHAILAVVLAIWMRVNVPVTFAAVMVNNPLTMVPLFLVAYLVGAQILGDPIRPFHIELSWHWLGTELIPIWKPFLLGCVIMGLAAAVTGYVLLGVIWHLTLVLKYRKRRANANGRIGAIRGD